MRILIVDDEPLARRELAFLIRRVDADLELSQADSVQSALEALLLSPVDVVFLDIHLQNESGMDLAKKINQMPSKPLIIFATAYDDYAVEAFRVEAIDYILKPFSQEQVREVLSRLTEKLGLDSKEDLPAQNGHTKHLPVETDDRIVLVNFSHITMIHVDDGVTFIQTLRDKFETKESLKAIASRLPDQQFLQVHRSYIINTQHVAEIEPWFNHTYQLTMVDGKKAPVSRTYIPNFRNFFNLN